MKSIVDSKSSYSHANNSNSNNSPYLAFPTKGNKSTYNYLDNGNNSYSTKN